MHAHNFLDLTGQKFSQLTVGSFAGRGKSGALWLCSCVCGGSTTTTGYKLTSGHTRSCGCLKRQLSRQRCFLHGGSIKGGRTREYQSWLSMRRRCLQPTDAAYPEYGGRGITICDRWLRDFAAFLSDMGVRPGGKYSLDRIDNDGNYEPSNCRWASAKEQAQNRRAPRRKAAA